MQISFSRHLIQLSINSASSTRGFHGICRKSFFLVKSVWPCDVAFVGERFSPTPPFFTLGGECRVIWFFPSGSRRRLCRLTCPPPAANSSSRFALRQRAFAALRSPASHLLLAPLLPQRSSFTSAPRRIPRLLCRAETSREIHFHGHLSDCSEYGGRTWI